MDSGRPASLVATCDQWVRARHENTAVEGDRGELTLSWTPPDSVPAPDGRPCPARGVATDRLCRIYRLTPTSVERLAVGPTEHGLDYVSLPEPIELIGGGPPIAAPGADFVASPSPPLGDAVGIAIDDDDRLFLADRIDHTISVIDLWSRRLLRSIRVDSPAHPDRRPVGLASHGSTVWALLREPGGLLRLSATRGPDEVPLPPSMADLPPDAEPSRAAVLHDGTPVLLFTQPSGTGWLVAGDRPPRNVGPASDLTVDADGAVVIAPCPSPSGHATFRRLTPVAGGWIRAYPLDATGYDGNGLVSTRDGRVGYFTAAGFRLAVIGRVTYETDGHCITYRLDSGIPRNTWGRLFLEACVPDETLCLVGAATSDDEYETALGHLPAEPAGCVPATTVSPPLPPDRIAVDGRDAVHALHRRPGSATPWWPTSGRYETHEAPIIAPPGRFLWVTLRLRGNGRRTPRVRELRVERQSHSLLRRLPRVFSGDDAQAAFLHRYLALFDGFVHDLDLRSRCRDVLVDPSGTPTEALDWLASFVGLVLDDRWAVAARRRLVREIVMLYRLRGTVWALGRYIEIFLAGDRAEGDDRFWVRPIIVEHFRLRGVGGPLLGSDATLSSRSVLGAGFRVGGMVGELGSRPLDPSTDSTSAYATHAHRFTVLIPRSLGSDEASAIDHILDTERPAHTAYSLCTVDAGMRVGRGLHVGLSSIIGPTGAFEAAVTDRSLIGRGAILGGRATGVAVESGRIGSARVG